MAKQIPTPGICRICKEDVTKRTIIPHLKKKHGEPGSSEKYLILIDTPYASPYWLAIAADPEETLADLDQVLRDVWVECCGHLSSFIIGGTEYSIDGMGEDLEDDFGESESMNIPLDAVLAPGMRCTYLYDYGSTTELKVRVSDTIPCDIIGDQIVVLGINNKPEAQCTKCQNKAVYHYTEWDDETVLCRSCSSDEEIDECYLLPITNSPRSGICGYEGGRFDEEPDSEEDKI
ncbi:MAG: hypothetical protein JXA44_04980 [Methanospirillaceae archaeon]|nr:hypothetical protein [Methanospirillaceae archaeon]